MVGAKDIRGAGPLPPKMAELLEGGRGSCRATPLERRTRKARQESQPPGLPRGPFATKI